MKRLFIQIVACVAVAVLLPKLVNGADKVESIRVLTYNIHHGAGTDGIIDLERIAGVIRSTSPDVVSLQEVDNMVARSNNVDQATELARMTGMHHVFGASIKLGKGHYGNAVLSRFPIKNHEIIPLPGNEKRSALCASLQINQDSPGKQILFIATHLGLDSKSRVDSAPLINNFIQRKENELLPAIFAGDLNAKPGSPAMMAFMKNWNMGESQENILSFPAVKPRIQIDYILFRPAHRWNVIEARSVEAPLASDHSPVLAVIELLTP